MTKREFMYDHDLDSVMYLIKQHMKANGMIQEDAQRSSSNETMNAKDFFI